LRSLFVKDKSVLKDFKSQPKAEKSKKGSLGAPMPGTVVEIKAKVGDLVKKGDALVVLSAMKMVITHLSIFISINLLIN